MLSILRTQLRLITNRQCDSIHLGEKFWPFRFTKLATDMPVRRSALSDASKTCGTKMGNFIPTLLETPMLTTVKTIL
jgi:hypothetical protein